MAHELVQKRRVYGASITSNAAADVLTFTTAVPADVYRFGYVAVASLDPDAGGFVVALDKNVLGGARTEIETVDRTDTQVVAAGQVVFHDVVVPVAESSVTGNGGSVTKVNVGPAGPLHLAPGDQAILEITNTSGVAVNIIPFIEYVEHDFVQPDTRAGSDGENVTKDNS